MIKIIVINKYGKEEEHEFTGYFLAIEYLIDLQARDRLNKLIKEEEDENHN